MKRSIGTSIRDGFRNDQRSRRRKVIECLCLGLGTGLLIAYLPPNLL